MTSRTATPRIHWHEALIGRSLAACAHPVAAWQSKTRSFRVLVLTGYFAIGYVAAMIAIAFI